MFLADSKTIAQLESALKCGAATRPDGGALPESVEGAYVSADGSRAYLVIEGVPHFLVEERLEFDPPLDMTPTAMS